MLDPDFVQSIPVWRMAVPQVSPSIPTQAEPEPDDEGVGTVKVPVTDVYPVPIRIAPAQLELYSTLETILD